MIAVRNLGVDDLPSIVSVERAAQDLPWSDEALLVELFHADAAVLGAFVDARLAGYVAVRRILDECWILNIATHPEVRRRGVGARLIDAARARGCVWLSSALWLEVRESNAAARSLYERSGLVVVGQRPGYYPPLRPGAPRETAVLMSRTL